MKLKTTLLLFSLFVSACSSPQKTYPEHWWAPIPKNEGKSWEILPHEANSNEVILSKRNELGVLSNFAHTPFKFEGNTYLSVEGFWQMMKYPESNSDSRFKYIGLVWPHKREKVAAMVAFDAKRAGDQASELMQKMGINWVTYKGEKLIYRTKQRGKHFQLIKLAMQEKLRQNPKVKQVLLATGNLILQPDHKQKTKNLPAWKYNEIWMEIRAELQAKQPE